MTATATATVLPHATFLAVEGAIWEWAVAEKRGIENDYHASEGDSPRWRDSARYVAEEATEILERNLTPEEFEQWSSLTMADQFGYVDDIVDNAITAANDCAQWERDHGGYDYD